MIKKGTNKHIYKLSGIPIHKNKKIHFAELLISFWE